MLITEVVRPPWPFRLPRPSMDGLLRRRGNGLVRLVHVGGEPVVVAVARAGRDEVAFAARAASEEGAREGIARLRFATGVDDDLAPFHARFRADPLLGRAIRADPTLRVRRQPEPWVALAWAIAGQLIDVDRASAIQRRMIGALGRRCRRTGLRDAPDAGTVAAQAPARLVSLGLAEKRALAMRRAAREVAAGRVELQRPPWPLDADLRRTGDSRPLDADLRRTGDSRPLDADLRRLRAIPEIGPWTVEMLALHGLGRLDVVPAGDLGYLELVGRLSAGHPRAIADEAEVRGFFAAYAPWAGLAGEYLRYAAASGRLNGSSARARTRWSAGARRPAAA